MKKHIILFLSLFMIMLVMPIDLISQAVDTTGISKGPFSDGVDLPEMLNWYNILFGALVLIWGYVAKAFNLKSEKAPFVFIVLAGGLVLAGAFVMFGWSEVFPLLFSFLSSIGIYDLIFKPAGLKVKSNVKLE